MFTLGILTSLLVVNVFLFIVSFLKVKNSGVKVKFITKWGIFDWAFIWEDVITISLYSIVTTLISILLKDIRLALLSYIIFFFVRASGETIYYFLQQFFPKKEYPHDQILTMPFWNIFFGDISEQKFYILTQVAAQMGAALSLFFLILILINWNTLEIYKWF